LQKAQQFHSVQVEEKITLQTRQPLQHSLRIVLRREVFLGRGPAKSNHGKVLLLGRRSLDAIAQLGRNYGPSLAHALGFIRGKTPSKSSLSRTLRRLDAQALENALRRWVCPFRCRSLAWS